MYDLWACLAMLRIECKSLCIEYQCSALSVKACAMSNEQPMPCMECKSLCKSIFLWRSNWFFFSGKHWHLFSLLSISPCFLNRHLIYWGRNCSQMSLLVFWYAVTVGFTLSHCFFTSCSRQLGGSYLIWFQLYSFWSFRYVITILLLKEVLSLHRYL